MRQAHTKPAAPRVGAAMLLCQVKRDVYGKEVQSAATYSYLWLADQVGHLCIGIVLDFLATSILEHLPHGLALARPTAWGVGFLMAAVAVSVWEYSTFRTDVRKAKPPFLLDKRLLAANAVTAAFYMVAGAALGWAFHLPSFGEAVLASLGAGVVAVLPAPWWLRQKIVWQKAGLPFLFRLADTESSILEPAARALEQVIAGAAPPGSPPQQVVIAGPVGSGRTILATAIGTEFAFRSRAVRYLSLDRLLEFASRPAGRPSGFGDDTGPSNIGYWPWMEAQVLVIDDIGPVVDALQGLDKADTFQALLAGPLAAIRHELGARHTVWIFGDLGSDGERQLDRVAQMVAAFCGSSYLPRQHPLAILLSQAVPPKVHRVQEARGAPASPPCQPARPDPKIRR